MRNKIISIQSWSCESGSDCDSGQLDRTPLPKACSMHNLTSYSRKSQNFAVQVKNKLFPFKIIIIGSVLIPFLPHRRSWLDFVWSHISPLHAIYSDCMHLPLPAQFHSFPFLVVFPYLFRSSPSYATQQFELKNELFV